MVNFRRKNEQIEALPPYEPVFDFSKLEGLDQVLLLRRNIEQRLLDVGVMKMGQTAVWNMSTFVIQYRRSLINLK
jgi:hypothetical protein